jgi:predicted AlkP superfamily pyrophosphatase or phosphodiesterase
MPSKTVVLCTVALTPSLVGEATPRLASFADGGALVPVGGVTPAVTATVQSTYLTGRLPNGHGAVGNGWLFRDTMEVRLWQQSNRLVQGPKVWEAAPGITCANLSWWFAMYSSADVTVTPRPMYPADGRKIPDCYTKPGDLRDSLQAELGQFPLFTFWGPGSSIDSTRWLAEAAKRVEARFSPDLTLVYLPHLDYGLQKKGPALDGVRGDLGELDPGT